MSRLRGVGQVEPNHRIIHKVGSAFSRGWRQPRQQCKSSRVLVREIHWGDQEILAAHKIWDNFQAIRNICYIGLAPIVRNQRGVHLLEI